MRFLGADAFRFVDSKISEILKIENVIVKI